MDSPVSPSSTATCAPPRAARVGSRTRSTGALSPASCAIACVARSLDARVFQITPKPRKFLRFSCVHNPMALVETIRQLWQRKLLVGIVLVLALAAAIFSAYRVSSSGLEKRSLAVAAASSQILVDSP